MRRAQEYIAAGDIYQANLSRPWQLRLAPGSDAVAGVCGARRANPAPFAARVEYGGMTILSSSPERLLACPGRDLSTRPIAGTRPRSGDAAQDARDTAELVAHPKERAEHVMLIDLERNDVGRVCEAGSVRVDEYMVTETYAHVHHIVSNVRGTLRADATAVDALRALFPGGTITGCPKIRCMQIIAALEGEGRGAYTGSLGWLGTDGDADFNILIRTLTLRGDRVELRAGAGIVADSDPRTRTRGDAREGAWVAARVRIRMSPRSAPGSTDRAVARPGGRSRAAVRRRAVRDDLRARWRAAFPRCASGSARARRARGWTCRSTFSRAARRRRDRGGARAGRWRSLKLVVTRGSRDATWLRTAARHTPRRIVSLWPGDRRLPRSPTGVELGCAKLALRRVPRSPGSSISTGSTTCWPRRRSPPAAFDVLMLDSAGSAGLGLRVQPVFVAPGAAQTPRRRSRRRRRRRHARRRAARVRRVCDLVPKSDDDVAGRPGGGGRGLRHQCAHRGCAGDARGRACVPHDRKLARTSCARTSRRSMRKFLLVVLRCCW
ncbi:MAG: chorismate-binding protein [Nocardioides sp.]